MIPTATVHILYLTCVEIAERVVGDGYVRCSGNCSDGDDINVFTVQR
jgi:hypothetical protein